MDVSRLLSGVQKKLILSFRLSHDVIDRFVEIPPQEPDAPDAFRFAVPGKLAGILEQADAKNVIERQSELSD